MHPLYEMIESYGLTPDRVTARLDEWTEDQTLDFLAVAAATMRKIATKTASTYSFIASSALSGGYYPCSNLECRIQRIDSAARFATLYADDVAIYDPLDDYKDVTALTPNERKELNDVLLLLNYIRPAVEQGTMGFVAKRMAFCRKHQQSILEPLEKRVGAAADALLDKYADAVTVTLERTPWNKKHLAFKFEGPEEYIEHGCSYSLLPETELDLHKLIKRKNAIRLTRQDMQTEASAIRAYRHLIRPLVEDLLIQGLHSAHGFRFVTDQRHFSTLAAHSNDENANAVSLAIIDGLAHTLPSLIALDIESLAKMRQEEGTSFKAYRDALNKLLRELRGSSATITSATVKQAFDDTIRPQLNKMDVVVEKAHARTRREIYGKVGFATASITVGVASGLFGVSAAAAAAVAPIALASAGAVAGALGGLKYADDIRKLVQEACTVPDNVEQEPFYYLWRLERQGEN
ncbi:MAG: hypothetical protein K8T25_02100 [Planctomycetia bacterium]|nr:hypothetical protein [Planctomycetia bacterium]